MCWILNIETTAEACSVALSNKSETSALIETHEKRSHASVLTVFIKEILQKNKIKASQLAAVAISAGPGSYTGLRIGISVAKGICYGANLPLIALPTLLVLTHGFKMKLKENGVKAREDAFYLPLIDARNKEVYSAIYNSKDDVIKETTVGEISEEIFQDFIDHSEYYYFGSGTSKYMNLFPDKDNSYEHVILPSAAYMSSIAHNHYLKKDFVDLAYFEPLYLKDFIATISKKNKIL